jgi:hypothetical protein
VPLGARTHLYGATQPGAGHEAGDRLLCELANTETRPAWQAGELLAWHWPVADTLVYPAASP